MKKEMKKSLIAERDMAQNYLDIAGVMLVVININQEVTLINNKGCEILGYPESKITGSNWFDNFIPERMREDIKGVFNEFMAGKGEMVKQHENPVLTRSGEERIIEWENTILRDQDGTITGTLSSGNDITKYRQTEKALSDSEELLQNALEISSDGLWDWNIVTGEINFSARWCETLGYELSEVTNHASFWETLIHPDDWKNVLDQLQAHLDGKTPLYECENRLLTKGGTYRWNLDRGRVIERDENGKPLRMIGVDADISERKQAEDEIRLSQEELLKNHEELNILFREVEIANKERQKIMDSVGDMIILTDDEGKIKRVNKSVKNFSTKPFEEIIGQDWEEFIYDNDMEATTLYAGSTELIHRSTNQWFVLNAYPFEDTEMNFSGTVITLHENSELKLITDKLEKTNAEINEHRMKLHNAHVQISSLMQNVTEASDTRIRLDNPDLKKCYEVKNCKKTECICYGKEATRCWQVAGTFCGGKIQGAFAQKYGNCLRCEVFNAATSDSISELGEQFNNMMHVLELKNRELENAYKELKASQSTILQQEKMASIGQLAAGVAHEINNPTGFITSNLGTLDKYTRKLTEFLNIQTSLIESCNTAETIELLNERRNSLKVDYIMNDVNDLIKESLDGADRIKNIVQNLKSFSRIDESKNQYADINECIESTLNIVWNELKYKTTIKKEYGNLPPAKCYPQQINQVIMNILVNAAQAIETQGDIFIKTWNGNGSVNISIADTGCGIPEDKLNKIFEPFYTSKEVGKGTGLGLSIAYDIIKKHNGELLVTSEIGEGTSFTIKLPLESSLSSR